jgi:SAM-dependent methyltransferase
MKHNFLSKCPMCDTDSDKSTNWCPVDNDGFITVQCENCELIYIQNPYDKDSLEKFYAKYYSEVHQDDQILNNQRKRMYEIELNFLLNFKNGGSVLDVGCSGGQFLQQFHEMDFDCQGVEFGIEASKEASKNFIIHVGEFPLINFEKKYDVIVFRGVIEHVRNPRKYLQKAISLLNPNGVIFITATQNRESLTCDLFRNDWNQHAPKAHLYHFALNDFVKFFNERGLVSYYEKNFYLETPYADVSKDLSLVLEKLKFPKKTIKCPPFFDTMMTAVFQF